MAAEGEKPGSDTPPNPRQVRMGSIVVDCTRLEEMVRFWTGALHYVPRGPVRPDGVMLQDPEGKGPNLNLNVSNEGPPKEYRLHLDLYVTDPLGELDRMVKLGATVTYPPSAGHDFVQLADPDGNPFCLIDIDWPNDRTYWGDNWSYGHRE
ncbi:MAG TPA: VOC family protein [Thermoplasmata archaeon]|nr:VOC family protein [Thermoplasmata archaeon]